MTWKISLGDSSGIRVHDYSGIRVGIAGMLIGAGLDSEAAYMHGENGVLMAQEYTNGRRMDWRTPPLDYRILLNDGRTVRLTSSDLPEDPMERCDGYDPAGDPCGRNMNHWGRCE